MAGGRVKINVLVQVVPQGRSGQGKEELGDVTEKRGFQVILRVGSGKGKEEFKATKETGGHGDARGYSAEAHEDNVRHTYTALMIKSIWRNPLTWSRRWKV